MGPRICNRLYRLRNRGRERPSRPGRLAAAVYSASSGHLVCVVVVHAGRVAAGRVRLGDKVRVLSHETGGPVGEAEYKVTRIGKRAGMAKVRRERARGGEKAGAVWAGAYVLWAVSGPHGGFLIAMSSRRIKLCTQDVVRCTLTDRAGLTSVVADIAICSARRPPQIQLDEAVAGDIVSIAGAGAVRCGTWDDE